MIDLKELQHGVYMNKVEKEFNVTDVPMEFCHAYGELGEAFDAYIKKKDTLGEELADVALYLLGIAEITGINLEKEMIMKHEKNKKRQYIKRDGVTMRIGD